MHTSFYTDLFFPIILLKMNMICHIYSILEDDVFSCTLIIVQKEKKKKPNQTNIIFVVRATFKKILTLHKGKTHKLKTFFFSLKKTKNIVRENFVKSDLI